MNASERFDRDLGELMADLVQPRFPDYFDEALERAVADRQRPAWTFPERWFPMGVLSRRRSLVPALPAPVVGVLVILMLLVAVTVAIGVGSLLLQPRPAPAFGLAANGLFAYSQDGDIYTTDPQTGETRLIVGGPDMDFAPWFSHDGTQVIFIRGIQLEPEEVVAVMMADASGANLRTLVEPEVAGEIHWGNLSPDGRLFAVANSADGVPRLSVVDVATGERIPIDVPVDVGPFEWLPDGSEIVFHGGPHYPAIYAVGPDGSGFRQVAGFIPGAIESTRLQVSHDGRYIGHDSRVDGSVTIHLYDLHADESRQIAPPRGGHVAFPVFSTDSRSVAYVRYDEATSSAQVVVAPLAAPDEAVDVGPRVFAGAYRRGLTAQFSPDSTRLLITSDDGEIWLADLESGTYEPIDIPKDEFELAWQRKAPAP
jgi:Tol biopolymer transport system component